MFDKATYEHAREQAAAAVDITRRFPEAVFKGEDVATTFCEVDAVFSADLWPAFAELAAVHGDEHVYLLVVEPGADDYKASYDRWPALRLPVTASVDDYWDAINDEPQGDITGALVNRAEVVVFVGDSGAWACWGERGPDIAAFRGFDIPELAGWRERYGPFLGPAETLDVYVARHFRDRVVPEGFRTVFMSNYF